MRRRNTPLLDDDDGDGDSNVMSMMMNEDDGGRTSIGASVGAEMCKFKYVLYGVFAALQIFLCVGVIVALTRDVGGIKRTRIVGPRIPRRMFFTWGYGNSNVSVETGSFDAALFNATIADMNVMKYTSVLPVESNVVPRENVSLEHGAVLEAIMAQCDGKKHDTITAGIKTVRVRRLKDNVELGGYVVEYPSSDSGIPAGTAPSGINVTSEAATANLDQAMEGLLQRRHGAQWRDQYEIHDVTVAVHTVNVTDDFGTIVVALGVADYILPVLEDDDDEVISSSIVTESPSSPRRVSVTDYREKYGMFLGSHEDEF